MTRKDKQKENDLPMEEWFLQASPEECDAMSALQLDYQFRGDNLGSMWWLHLQELGFKHIGTTRKYELPASSPDHGKVYSGNEIYEQLDRFAIPKLTNPFQPFPRRPHDSSTKERDDWWKKIREELIFRSFFSEMKVYKGKKRTDKNVGKAGPKPTRSSQPSRKRKPGMTDDAGAELFMRKGKKGKPVLKPNQTDPNVVFPTVAEFAKAAKKMSVEEAEEHEDDYSLSFEEWKFQMIMNQSLLLYGVGSKQKLLTRFANSLDEECDVIEVNGFDKDVTIEGILDLITNNWLGGRKPAYNRYAVHVGRGDPNEPYGGHNYPLNGEPSIVQRAIGVGKALGHNVSISQSPLCLVLHSIDGIGLRNATAQEALAALVSASTTSPRGLNGLRLAASVDNVNSPALLWDSLTLNRFRWVWKEVHTGRPYILELTRTVNPERLPRMSLQQKRVFGDTTERSIFSVLTSLAPRHTETLKQLATLQCSQTPGEDSTRWVEHKELLQLCHFKCIVNGDTQLRDFLKELGDHGLVERSTGGPSTLSYQIPFSEEKLNQILEFERDANIEQDE